MTVAAESAGSVTTKTASTITKIATTAVLKFVKWMAATTNVPTSATVAAEAAGIRIVKTITASSS